MGDKPVCKKCGRDFGRMRFNGEEWFCVGTCTSGIEMRDTAKSVFPYTTMNIGRDPNKGPITVQSLRHLRQLENQHGVASAAFNMDSKNMDRR